MSKVQKLKKSKKGMNPESKRNLGLCFKSIISNQACVDGGKDAPWWIAIIFLCISVVLPLIPIMTKTSQLSGSSFLTGYSYNTDVGLYETTKNIMANNVKAKVSGGNLSFYDGDVKFADDDPRLAVKEDVPYAIASCVQNSEYVFRYYITNLKGSKFDSLITQLTKVKYVQGSTTPRAVDDPKGTKYYIPSFIVLGKETLVMALYGRHQSEASGSSPAGLDWNNTVNNKDLFEHVCSQNPDIYTATSRTFNSYKTIFDDAYITSKGAMFTKTTLIYLGVYAGLIFFLGLMIFILTRGKNNVFKFMSFFCTQKIAWWAAFTPALLGMILAYILPGTSAIGQMAFVVLVSLRIMWLSMKQLKPVQ